MVQKICNAILALVLVAILGVLGVLVYPMIRGYKTYAVQTASMEPSYPVGCIIVVEEVSPEVIEMDDVITFYTGQSTIVTHRVIGIDKENRQFSTKGDNNPNADYTPIPYDALIGRLNYSIPYLGGVAETIKTPKGIIRAVMLLVVMILLFILPDIFSKEQPEEAQGGTVVTTPLKGGSVPPIPRFDPKQGVPPIPPRFDARPGAPPGPKFDPKKGVPPIPPPGSWRK